MKNSGLSEQELEQIRAVLRAVPAIEKAVLFGSRAMGLARGNSDVDIMLYGEKLTLGDVAHARALLEETTLPYQFDLVLYDAGNESLREHIEQHGRILLHHSGSSTHSWATSTLESAGVMLIDCDHRTPKEQIFGFPYITIPQLKDGRIVHSEARKISKEDFTEWTKKLMPREHDVVVVRRCNSGENAVVPANLHCAIGQNLVVLRSNGEHVYPPFLRWLVRGQEWWEEVRKFINVGAVFDSLRCRDIPKFELPIPPKAHQKQIASMLDALDDRIQLLRETNATLEAMAQALFKSWFVDFDPVHAKAEGRSPEGMDAKTAALFPAEFEESELGMLPKGWKVAPVDNLFSIGIGKTPPRKESQWFSGVDSYKWLSIRDMGQSGVYISNTTENITKAAAQKFNIILVPNNSVVLSFKLTIGRVCLTDGCLTTNEAIAHFKPSSENILSSEYLFLYLKQFKYATLGSTSSIATAINSKMVKKIPIIIPHPKVAFHFQEAIKSLFGCVKNNSQQVATLTALRDTLLPRLISGKLRLPEFADTTTTAAP